MRGKPYQDIIETFSPPIEMMVERGHPIAILGVEQHPKSDEKLRKIIDTYRDSLGDHEQMAVHETTREAAEKIHEQGFGTLPPRSHEANKLRADSAFFWIHEPDIGNRPPQDDNEEHYIVVAGVPEGVGFVSCYNYADRAGGMSHDEYLENATVMDHQYRRYIEYNPVSDTHTKGTLLPFDSA